MEYISIPLVLRDGLLSRTDTESSIIYSIALVLCTRIGQLPFAPNYGCSIWDREFTDLETTNKADIQGSLRIAIDRHEKRLYNVDVTFGNVKDESPHVLGLSVFVSGNYLDDGKEKRLDASFRVG